MKRLALLACLLAVAPPAHAQVYSAPTEESDSTSSTDSTSNGGTQNKQQQKSGSGPEFLGTSIPFLDPGNEVVSWDGRHWNVTNNRIFSARFEKYLNAPEGTSEEDRAYRDTLDAILEELSPHNGKPDLRAAVALLPRASSFPIDARLCDSLAGAVYGVYLGQRNVAGLHRMNEDLDHELRRIDFRIEQESQTNRFKSAQKRNGEPSGPLAEAAVFGSITTAVGRKAEIAAFKQVNRGKAEISALRSKVEFQALLIQFFLQRRFEHCIIGCRMYRTLFTDGDSTLQIEEGSDVEKIFGQSMGINPTISTLDSFASEAIRDVAEGIDAFRFLLGRGELDSASKRLAEAFLTGEFLEKVRTLPRDEKREVVGYVRDSNQLIATLEVKDYLLAEELVGRMREQASDFDHSKAMAAVTTAKTVSDMQISKARNAMIKGDEATFEEAVRNATEVWPTNPKLAQLGQQMDTGGNLETQALIDLQGLIAQKNYRQIHRDQARYIVAVRNDTAKQEQLAEILGNVARVDMALVQAEKLQDSGNLWAAWELVEQTREDFPDDSDLNRRRADLSTEVAPFVNALKTAESLEQRDQTGSSLAWFLRAKMIYPHSDLARGGVERLSDKVLAD
ncbi:hypothetical protein BH23VER1_BH23VER1_36280 [soil metagenome]